jgi:hypothetical protein
MPTEPQEPTLSDVAHRATQCCDPDGHNEALAQYLREFEDRDEPVTGVADLEGEATSAARRVDPDAMDPAVTMAAAVTTYLGFKRGQLDTDDRDLLRLAARSEFAGDPPDHVRDWLRTRGVDA